MKPEGYHQAIGLLRQAQTPAGFVASPYEHDNYKRVWTRDGVVCGLAALLSKDQELTETFRATLETIFNFQHPLGFIPSNVGTDGKTSYGGTVGRADNPSWAVIGLCQYSLFTGDDTLSRQFETNVKRCLHVLDIWEFNGKHLIYVPQSGDWADESIYHGYLLFDQLLRVWALELASRVYQRGEWMQKAEQIRHVVEANFWNHRMPPAELYAPNVKHQIIHAPKEFWLMGFNPSRVYDQFDLQANAMAMLLGLGSDVQKATVVAYVQQLIEEQESVLPSFHPSIQTTDADMMELANNFAFRFRNHPYEFHNGGLWPVWNGFLAAALTRSGENALAHQLTNFIHAANGQAGWNFNECLHGLNKKPIGVQRCTWSAAGAVLAENSLNGLQLF
jgi:glycogen debranching enzyme